MFSRNGLLLTFNTQRPSLQKAPARCALTQLVNVADLNCALEQGPGLLTVSLISPNESTNVRELTQRQFDLAAATASLQAAEWQKHVEG